MNDFRLSLNKYIFPVILIALGIMLMAMGAKQWDVDSRLYWFFLAAVGVFLVGILSLFYSMGKVTAKMQKLLVIPALILSAVFLYGNVQSIKGKIAYEKERDHVRAQVIQKMKDVRTAQHAFKDAKGTYTNSWTELIDFVKNGQVPIYKNIGSIPDSIEGGLHEAIELGLVVKMPADMTDEQAAASGLIIRDTLFASVQSERFETEKELSKRKFPFDINSLQESPYEGKFTLQVGRAEIGGVQRPTVQCRETHPYPGSDTLAIGSLSEAHTNGNWKE